MFGDAAFHASYASTAVEQAAINAPGIGVVWNDLGVASRRTQRRRKRLLLEAERVIRERYGEFDLGLADIADAAGCSPRHLQRVFREVGDTEFRAVLLQVRMERAHQLLSRKKDGLTVGAAARAVGLKGSSGLRQQFVRFYGYNPSDIQGEPPDYSELWRAEEAASGTP